MSKSEGNATSPSELMEQNGADILRLWVTGSDYTEDIKFGQNILKGHVDIYRRLRNTFCYLLGSLDGTGSDAHLSDLDQYILHRVYEIDRDVRQGIADFDFQGVITTVHNFCARELSAFYFDICKDTLYCDALDSDKRRGVVYVLEKVFQYLCHWLSPVLVFTTEEAWLAYKGLGFDDVSESIHLSVLPKAPAAWQKDDLAKVWEQIIAVRSVVTGALEVKRAEKEVKSSLEAAPIVYIADHTLADRAKALGFADICIVSDVDIRAETPPKEAYTLENVEGVGVVFAKADGDKCDRCWKYTTDTGSVSGHDTVCARCGTAVNADQKSRSAA